MAPLPAGIRIAQTLGITTSAFVAGSIMSISFFNVPALLQAPSPLIVRQWQTSYDRGKIINPAITLVSAITYFSLSYRLYGGLNHPKAEWYALSGLLALAIWPWTLFVMFPTNEKLFKKNDETQSLGITDKADESDLAKGESTKELVDKWGFLNLSRGMLPLASALLGTWATLS